MSGAGVSGVGGAQPPPPPRGPEGHGTISNKAAKTLMALIKELLASIGVNMKDINKCSIIAKLLGALQALYNANPGSKGGLTTKELQGDVNAFLTAFNDMMSNPKSPFYYKTLMKEGFFNKNLEKMMQSGPLHELYTKLNALNAKFQKDPKGWRKAYDGIYKNFISTTLKKAIKPYLSWIAINEAQVTTLESDVYFQKVMAFFQGTEQLEKLTTSALNVTYQAVVKPIKRFF